MKTKYSREDLIKLCEKAIVNEAKWQDRDSQGAVSQVGVCWALLKAGCEFRVLTKADNQIACCITNENTVWIEICSKGFNWFEHCGDPSDPDSKIYMEDETFYLPTESRIKTTKGEDWY